MIDKEETEKIKEISNNKIKKSKNEKKLKNIVSEFASWAFYIAAAVIASYLIIVFVGQKTQVVGSSMYDTLEDGDHLILDKLTYKFSEIKRFDIVVFPYRLNKSDKYIKRVIGLPGESVLIKDSKIYINGELLEEDYGTEPIASGGRAEEIITLGEDEYFVMGDNRNNSKDSRYEDVGNINRKDIIGRAIFRLYPFNKFGPIK